MDSELDKSKIIIKQIVFRRRRDLLPWWVEGSTWLFLVFFALVPVGIILGLFGSKFEISLLGLRTDSPISVIGLFLISVFTLKGIVAYGLWTEKKWAVSLAKTDAIISIVICCGTMAYSLFVPENHMFSLRLELVIIVPYFYKMNMLQYDWEYFGEQNDTSPAIITEV